MPLQVYDLSVAGAGGTLFGGLSFAVQPSTVTCVLGPSNSGKTRLLETIAGIVTPPAGEIILSGKAHTILNQRRRARLRGLLLPPDPDPFPMTVEQRVAVAIGERRLFGLCQSKRAVVRIEHALRLCELIPYRDRLICDLDRDVQRRVDFAVLAAQHPSLWLLDEPNNYLSPADQSDFLDRIVEHIRASHAGCVMSFHNTTLAQRYADDVILLTGDGRVITGPPQHLSDPEIMSELTGRPLVDSDRDTA